MKNFRAIAALGLLCVLPLAGACGGEGGAVQTVQAQGATYSDSNMSGTYNLELAGVSTSGAPVSGSGSITANGSGQISSGSYSIAVSGFPTCSGSLSGSYTVSSSGSGTATLSATPNSTSMANGCPTATLSLSLAASASGNTIGFSEADSTEIAAGVAVK